MEKNLFDLPERYQEVELIGKGGMAHVYQAFDTKLKRHVAVKVIDQRKLSADGLKEYTKRFKQEAQILAGFSHMNLVNVWDFGEYEGNPYITMECLPHGTLENKMDQAVYWQDAVEIMFPILEGIAYAHRRNIIHRDIKPSNILLRETGEPVLSDFGLAKSLEPLRSVLTLEGSLLGTPEYMSPEQARGQSVDSRTDIYSVGVIFYELVTGRLPYEASPNEPLKIIIDKNTEPIPDPIKFVPDLPEEFRAILYKALAKDPSNRYQKIEELIFEIANLLKNHYEKAGFMERGNVKPRVFISYSWESDEHKSWVKQLATQLRKDGVNAVLDHWNAVPGDPLPEFMEREIRDSDYVLVVCTPTYKNKSDNRTGGVGYEGGLITGELFLKHNHRKFIPILAAGDWANAAPSWATTKFYIDIRGTPYSESAYSDLLKTLLKGRSLPPTIGDASTSEDNNPEHIDLSVGEEKTNVPNEDAANKGETSLPGRISNFITDSKKKIGIGLIAIIGFALIGYFGYLIIMSVETSSPTPPDSASDSNANLPSKIIDPLTNVVMHLVPAGDFVIGSDSEASENDEKPLGSIYLDAFYIDETEVTNELYMLCVNEKICSPPVDGSSSTRPNYYENPEFSKYPVIYVDWNMANTLCEWRGGRLPTEAEWEKAARGTRGDTYPWGDELSCDFANFGTSATGICQDDTTPVDSYANGKSFYGLYNMAGNVNEWVSSLYLAYPYDADDGRENLYTSGVRVIRGGSWNYLTGDVRSSNRNGFGPTRTSDDIGFRCAKDPVGSEK